MSARMARVGVAVPSGLLMLMLAGCAATRPFSSATPTSDVFQVDEHLYRGAQPTAEGLRWLQVLGVKTVISLRAQGKAARQEEQQLVESLGMRWVSLPMRMYWRPTETQIQTFLAVALDPNQQPAFVHCEKGEDRTGSLVAVYRIVKQGWAPERAYAEAVSLGLASWNPFMRHLILYEAQREYGRTPTGSGTPLGLDGLRYGRTSAARL